MFSNVALNNLWFKKIFIHPVDMNHLLKLALKSVKVIDGNSPKQLASHCICNITSDWSENFLKKVCTLM